MKRLIAATCLLSAFLIVTGCGEDKPKNNGVQGELKPLPTPGSPGGEAPAKGKAAPGGSASTG